MIQLFGPAACEGDHRTRRQLLQAGGAAALGLTLPQILAQPSVATPASTFGRARSCVVIFLFGGPSHIDLWDLKPEAPAEVRGEFNPIDTHVPGIRICEHLPRLATKADRYCLIR